jgi:hypothetical protein
MSPAVPCRLSAASLLLLCLQIPRCAPVCAALPELHTQRTDPIAFYGLGIRFPLMLCPTPFPVFSRSHAHRIPIGWLRELHLASARRPGFQHCLSNCGSRASFGRRFFCSWSRNSRDVGRGRGILRSDDWCRCRTAPHCQCGYCSRPGHCRSLSRAWPDRGVCRELGACLPRLLFHRASTHLCYSWCGLFGSCSHGLCGGGPSGGGCFALGGRSGGQICLFGPRGAEAGVRSASCS